MDTARWELVQQLFHSALGQPVAERDAFLKARCGPDVELRAQVLAMLAQDERDQSLLDNDLAAVAGRIFSHAANEGTQLGSYRLKGMLGEGGTSIVYLAEREDLGSD